MTKKHTKNPWPAKLRALQDRLGLSNAEIADKLGVLERTWLSWKYGERMPSSTSTRLLALLIEGKL